MFWPDEVSGLSIEVPLSEVPDSGCERRFSLLSSVVEVVERELGANSNKAAPLFARLSISFIGLGDFGLFCR